MPHAILAQTTTSYRACTLVGATTVLAAGATSPQQAHACYEHKHFVAACWACCLCCCFFSYLMFRNRSEWRLKCSISPLRIPLPGSCRVAAAGGGQPKCCAVRLRVVSVMAAQAGLHHAYFSVYVGQYRDGSHLGIRPLGLDKTSSKTRVCPLGWVGAAHRGDMPWAPLALLLLH